jgi:hypothetical protein
MDYISKLENELYNTILSIDGTTQSTGYKYYSNTGTVQVYDEVLSLGRNIALSATPSNDYKSVNHIVEQQESTGIEGQDWSTGQWAYTNRVVYVIKSKVHNIGNESDYKNAIRTRMNEVYNDLLFAIGQNYTLNGMAQYIRFLNAYREYEDITNNRIQTGTIITQWEVIFSQSINNPDVPACY